MNTHSHRHSSARRQMTVGALAGLLAGLTPLALNGATMPTPSATPVAPATAPEPTPVASAAAPAVTTPAVAPAPAGAAPASTAGSPALTSLMDRSPYSETYVAPVTTAPIGRITAAPPTNVQFNGHTRIGDQVYVSVVDARTKLTHWVAMGDTWNIPNGGSLTVNSISDDGSSINVMNSGRNNDVPLAKPANIAPPVAGLAPSIILSTGPMNQGGRRGGGGFGGPGGPAGGFGGGLTGAGGGGFAGGGGAGGGRRGGGANGVGGNGNGGGGRGANGGGGFGGAGNGGGGGGGFGNGGGGGGGRGAGGGAGFGAAGGGAAGGGGGFNTGTNVNTVNAGTTTNNGGGAATRRQLVPPGGG